MRIMRLLGFVLVGGIIYAVATADPQAPAGTASEPAAAAAPKPGAALHAERCALMKDPVKFVDGLEAAGIIVRRDGENFIVNDDLWFTLKRSERIGMVAGYACGTNQLRVWANSSKDGRTLARYREGEAWET